MSFDPKDTIGYLVHRSAKEMRRKLSKAIAVSGHELSMEQWRVLMILHHQEAKNQQDIADLMGHDKTSLTRLLSGMEDKGLIVRVADKRDKRNKLIYATNLGREQRELVMPIVEQNVIEVEKLVNPAELVICKKILNEIIQNLCNDNENGPCSEA